MDFPVLYRQSESENTLFWKVSTIRNEVTVTFGVVGSANIQTTTDVVTSGKNIGTSRETSTEEQTVIKAQQLWDKKSKQGYVQSIEQAQRGYTGLEGIKPMLAKKFEENMSKLTFPLYMQPKLDGMRCVAICDNGVVRLFTRTQKPIKSAPHIVEQIYQLMPVFGNNFILDGEIYNHGLSDNFEKLMSVARKDSPSEESHLLEYWIYDIVMEGKFSERNKYLHARLSSVELPNLVSVPTFKVNNIEELNSVEVSNMQVGYEGSMVRLDGPYENKRSSNLLKVKRFIDDEFLIVGYTEGNGKLRGHVGSFKCVTKSNKTFNVKLDGDTERLKTYFENFDVECLGKLITVRFFEYTNEGIPRFPVGKGIRE